MRSRFNAGIGISLAAWVSATSACNVLMDSGGLSAEGCPAPGLRECVDSTSFRVCAPNGKWKPEVTCESQVCKGGKCIGECMVGDKRCSSDNTPQQCTMDGQWVDVPTGACINQTCDPETLACVGECVQNQIRCRGNTPEKCNMAGQWESIGEPCSGNLHCEGGKCVDTCIPKDQRCNGDMPQVCNENGSWENDGPVCDTCIGCNPNTGQCALFPKPDGSPCSASANKCVVDMTCQGGVCKENKIITCVQSGVGPCNLDTCDPATGTCIPPNGALCEDGDICTISSACQEGMCSPEGDRAWAHWDFSMPIPSPRYTWTDDVVYDKWTHLIWQRKAGGGYDFKQAENYCKCLNGENTGISCDQDKILGYPSGWRVPSATELLSLVDYDKHDPSIDTLAFPNAPSASFWTSSVYAADSSKGWLVIFANGGMRYYDGSSPFRVRCVR